MIRYQMILFKQLSHKSSKYKLSYIYQNQKVQPAMQAFFSHREGYSEPDRGGQRRSTDALKCLCLYWIKFIQFICSSFPLFKCSIEARRTCTCNPPGQQCWLPGAQSDKDVHFGGQNCHKLTNQELSETGLQQVMSSVKQGYSNL